MILETRVAVMPDHLATISDDEGGHFFLDPATPAGIHHVYPVDPHGSIAHRVDGDSCWCDPVTYRVCPACEDGSDADPECWQCGGEGILPVEFRDPGEKIILVHNAAS